LTDYPRGLLDLAALVQQLVGKPGGRQRPAPLPCRSAHDGLEANTGSSILRLRGCEFFVLQLLHESLVGVTLHF
jgi:hypothetical protein